MGQVGRILRTLALLVMVALVGTGIAHGQPPNRHDLAQCPQGGGFSPNSHENQAMLVPRGSIRLVLCRYTGTIRQVRTVVVKSRLIRVITRELNRLPPLPQHRMWVSCPKSDGTIVNVILHYRGRPIRIVRVEANGCEWVKAGKQRRWAYNHHGWRLIRRLEALTDCRARPRTRFGCH